MVTRVEAAGPEIPVSTLVFWFLMVSPVISVLHWQILHQLHQASTADRLRASFTSWIQDLLQEEAHLDQLGLVLCPLDRCLDGKEWIQPFEM